MRNFHKIGVALPLQIGMIIRKESPRQSSQLRGRGYIKTMTATPSGVWITTMTIKCRIVNASSLPGYISEPRERNRVSPAN
jgi:hypothetical protein